MQTEHTKRSATKRTPNEQPDPWEPYHLLLAMSLVLGAIATCHDIADIIKRMHELSGLEESGLAAALLIGGRGVARYAARYGGIVVAIVRALRR
jgi:hypothetical protein